MATTEIAIEGAVFMHRALQLAALGLGNVSPNPMVGCVIVNENKIIGEGYHQHYGSLHAEPNAIQSVENQSLLPFSTLYVNLEPCNHWGKTPPCTDLIIEKKIAKVVIANIDSNPLVAGKGIEKLRNAGIAVQVGLLENEGSWLNRRFFKYQTKRRPYIILKWAQTADGFMAKENLNSKWISNQYSRILVHKWRSEEDAILVGFNTALYDNPQLNVRELAGRNPVRIVLDRNLEIPRHYHLFDQSQKTLVINTIKQQVDNTIAYIETQDVDDVIDLISNLYISKLQSVIVEGGSHTIQNFINENMWDEARIFISDTSFGKGIKAPSIQGKLVESQDILGDRLEIRVNDKRMNYENT